MRIVSVDTADRRVRVEPRAIKQALAGEMVPDDMHNDVWWLDVRHNRQPVDARPGDRLVLTLEEIPSSGYSWRFVDRPDDVRVLADSYQDDWEPELGSAPGADDELAGDSHPRSLVLEIAPDADRAIHRLALVKDQPWEPDSQTDEFELLLSVNPSLTGLQLPEADLALPA